MTNDKVMTIVLDINLQSGMKKKEKKRQLLLTRKLLFLVVKLVSTLKVLWAPDIT
jgi:hypothetical protein